MSDRLVALRDQAVGWLCHDAVPLWTTTGIDPRTGAFHEALTPAGEPVHSPRRARVQPRQLYALAVARHLGADVDPCALTRAWDRFCSDFGRADGLFRTLVGPDGRTLDDRALLYDQAFVLLALAHLDGVVSDADGAAVRLRAGILALFRAGAGGFVAAPTGSPAFLSNPHMHLLEACLAWADNKGRGDWWDLAATIVELALKRFRLPRSGAIAERFDLNWHPADDGEANVEPGHQFEWAWLLLRWSRLADNAGAATAALELFEIGERHGVDRRGVAVNSLCDDLRIADSAARLWPQTERLKAGCAALEHSGEPRYSTVVEDSAGRVKAYLCVPRPGLWYDVMAPGGGLVDGPAPASSFYHIVCAIDVLHRTALAVGATEARP